MTYDELRSCILSGLCANEAFFKHCNSLHIDFSQEVVNETEKIAKLMYQLTDIGE